MRKFFIFILLVFILVSCQPDDDFDVKTMNNYSSYEINFKFTDSSELTLKRGESVSWAGRKSGSLEYYSDFKYVDYNFVDNKQAYGGGTGTFTDRTPYTVRVNNTLEVDASLSEFFLEESLTIMKKTENNTGTIYTKEPKFVIQTESGFPARCYYNFNGNTMMVTITW